MVSVHQTWACDLNTALFPGDLHGSPSLATPQGATAIYASQVPGQGERQREGPGDPLAHGVGAEVKNENGFLS